MTLAGCGGGAGAPQPVEVMTLTPSVSASAAIEAPPLAVPPRDLVPDKTDAVITGVLRWENSRLANFDDRNRKDEELHARLAARGTSPERLSLLLDARATRGNILEHLHSAARRAKPDGVLVFYYAGHGLRNEAGDILFANYDIDLSRLDETGLSMKDISAALAEVPKTTRVLLLADCCFSGALAEVVDALAARGVRAASVTSADLSNTSTVNWTFTQTVIDALVGDSLADRDKDGIVELGELDREVADAMKFRESQRSARTDRGIGDDFALATTIPGGAFGAETESAFPLGSYAIAPRGSDRLMVRVRAKHENALSVRLFHYANAEDFVVPAEDLETPAWKRYPKDTELAVTWGGKLWDAKVIATDGDFHRIHYPGWPAYWDEWILSDRIASVGRVDASQPVFTLGQRVMVEWKSKWWPAQVIAVDHTRYRIHYDGYDSSWDEWVTAPRMRGAP